MPFRDVNGHRRIIELLARSVARDSLPPSLIFAGPAGSGKRLTALAVAQALNCQQPAAGNDPPTSSSQPPTSNLHPPAIDACGICAVCTRIARGVHPDVLVLEPGDTGSIRIDDVREAIGRTAYRPFEGKYRIVIIDQADALVLPAQNALLKTLEEPPSASVFILITARPDVLLPTVRSRCIRLWFAAGAAHQVDEPARDVAQRVLAYAASTPDPRRRIEGAQELLAKTGRGGASDREQLAGHLRAMASLLRDAGLLAARADAGRLLANPQAREALDALSRTYRGERGVRAFAAVDRALAALDRNAGVKTVADWLVLEL